MSWHRRRRPVRARAFGRSAARRQLRRRGGDGRFDRAVQRSRQGVRRRRLRAQRAGKLDGFSLHHELYAEADPRRAWAILMTYAKTPRETGGRSANEADIDYVIEKRSSTRNSAASSASCARRGCRDDSIFCGVAATLGVMTAIVAIFTAGAIAFVFLNKHRTKIRDLELVHAGARLSGRPLSPRRRKETGFLPRPAHRGARLLDQIVLQVRAAERAMPRIQRRRHSGALDAPPEFAVFHPRKEAAARPGMLFQGADELHVSRLRIEPEHVRLYIMDALKSQMDQLTLDEPDRRAWSGSKRFYQARAAEEVSADSHPSPRARRLPDFAQRRSAGDRNRRSCSVDVAVADPPSRTSASALVAGAR
ncbi:MAG: hypothetical protein MZW92_02515 [Comamonadaceae bacterium]|nr:hypothetical protein [Comamonadaceae bacterium]